MIAMATITRTAPTMEGMMITKLLVSPLVSSVTTVPSLTTETLKLLRSSTTGFFGSVGVEVPFEGFYGVTVPLVS